MYGTVARLRVKPGLEEKLQQDIKSYEGLNVPGYVQSLIYRMDTDPQEHYMAVVFDSEESYRKNADDPAQDARYREFLTFLEAEPEWHDGEIVYSLG